MIITAGSTSVSINVYFVDDDGGTAPGEPTTGLLFSNIETGGSASYARQGAARVDFTLVTLASASAVWTEGGFILIDDTNMPGVYRLDIPNAAVATAVDFVTVALVEAGANNTVMRPVLIDITDVDLRDSVRGGMTALPNVAAGSAGGLPDDTDANGAVRIVDGTGAREINTNVGAIALVDLCTTTTTAVNLTTNNDKTGYSLSAGGVDAIWDETMAGHTTADTAGLVMNDWQDAGRLDVILDARMAEASINTTGGAVDTVTTVTTVAGLAANVLTAASINAAAFTAAKFATDALDANALATDAVNEIRDAILPTQNAAFDNIEFLFVDSTDHVTPVTGAGTLAVTRSIDGGAFGAGTGTGPAEVGNGIYQYDASAADMNGGVITFRFTATTGTPNAPDDRFLTVVTGGGV